jgi:hypothetical protein
MRFTEAPAARSCLGRWRITSTGWACAASAQSSSPGAHSRPATCRRAARSRSITRFALHGSGSLDEAVSILDQAVAQARRRGDVFNVAFMLMWRGKSQTDRGDLRAAVADLRDAIDLCVAHGMLVAWPYNVGFLAHALLEQGDEAEAARVVDQGDFPEQLPVDQVHLVWFRLIRGRLRIETGSAERGVEELLQIGETARLFPTTIQSACSGAAGPPWAFDSSTETRKRVRSPRKSSRSLDGG